MQDNDIDTGFINYMAQYAEVGVYVLLHLKQKKNSSA